MDAITEFYLVKTAFFISLLAAAIFDVASFRIPNVIVVALLALWVVVALLNFAAVSWLDHLIAGGVFFIGGLVFYALGQMGAGDVKLLAVVALWGGVGAMLSLAFWISLSGLLLIAVILLLRWLIARSQLMWRVLQSASLPKILVRGEGAPYGAAIFLGTSIARADFPQWLWAF